MKLLLVALLSAMSGVGFLLSPEPISVEPVVVRDTVPNPRVVLEQSVTTYLEGRISPLAASTDTLIEQKHWKLLIAISAIESQFCKRKIAYNCWGIKGSNGYRQYDSYDEAIVDANALIERWQAKGKWLTPESMLGSYVVPGSANWLYTVKSVLKELDGLVIYP